MCKTQDTQFLSHLKVQVIFYCLSMHWYTVHCLLESKVRNVCVLAINFANPVYTGTYLYILVHNCIYMYRLVHAVTSHTVLWIRLEHPCYAVWSGLQACAVHHSQHPSSLQSPWCSGLPDGACPSQTATAKGWPCRHCCPVCPSVAAAIAIQEAWIRALAEHMRDCWCRVTSQKQWDKGDSAHNILDISHAEARCLGWFIQLDHSRVLHRPLDRQFKLFKSTDETKSYRLSSGPVL
jgi:hypothetical protein